MGPLLIVLGCIWHFNLLPYDDTPPAPPDVSTTGTSSFFNTQGRAVAEARYDALTSLRLACQKTDERLNTLTVTYLVPTCSFEFDDNGNKMIQCSVPATADCENDPDRVVLDSKPVKKTVVKPIPKPKSKK